jgi:transcriptional regulator with XRE-family HTH domain
MTTPFTYIDIPDLRAAMREAGMTQMKLSYATGIDQAQISRYVTGAATPSPRNAAKIAEALGLLNCKSTSGTVQVSENV